MTTTLTARDPVDLLAAVPLVLGFRPAESLVMLTFGGDQGFHARVDLPPEDDPTACVELTGSMLDPCLTHRVPCVAFVVYTADAPLAASLAASLVPAFVAAGIGVVDVLRVEEDRWCRVSRRARARETALQSFDPHDHPFSVHAVFEGRVTLASREELARQVTADDRLRERWCAALGRLDEPAPDEDQQVADLLGRLVTAARDPTDAEAARVLRSIRRVEVRDAAIGRVPRAVAGADARDHLRLWATLLRGAPGPHVADVAAVTAFCAWQAGDGALAWCALDRCFEAEPAHRLGSCLALCLTHAVPPSAWEEVGTTDL
ncbi:MAG: DUF4192 domain-containing protein [Nocardioides sp.]